MSGLRITGGELRGRRIPLPPHQLRPTSSKARQAFFNIVASEVEGSHFLDLFAGSGIFSFEAVSRGARSATAIDQSVPAVRNIEKLARDWNLPIRTIASDVLEGLKRTTSEHFSLVYADPPYDYPLYADLLATLDQATSIADQATVAVEHRSGFLLPEAVPLSRLSIRKTAVYGSVSISLFDAGA